MDLARDAEQRVLRCANAGVPKAEQADEILLFVEFTGSLPTELVFDSQLMTYQKLSHLNRQAIRGITLRRRSWAEQSAARIFRSPIGAEAGVTGQDGSVAPSEWLTVGRSHRTT